MKTIQIVVEDDKKAKLEKIAKSMGHTLSSWGRWIFNREIEKSDAKDRKEL